MATASASDQVQRPNWIKAGEVAEIVGVSVHTVRSWRLRGVGPPYTRVGGAVNYERTEITDWLDTKHHEGD